MYLVAAAVVVILLLFAYRKWTAPPSLYTRLGGIYNIALIVDRFSDKVLSNPVVGRGSSNAALRAWAETADKRMPGLKWMRTLWLADVAGGPYTYVSSREGSWFSLNAAHCPMQMGEPEFAAVAAELAAALDHYNVPAREKAEVLAAFSAHRSEIINCTA